MSVKLKDIKDIILKEREPQRKVITHQTCYGCMWCLRPTNLCVCHEPYNLALSQQGEVGLTLNREKGKKLVFSNLGFMEKEMAEATALYIIDTIIQALPELLEGVKA